MSRWEADRDLIVGTVENEGAGGEPVDIRRLHVGVTVYREVHSEVVYYDEDDISITTTTAAATTTTTTATTTTTTTTTTTESKSGDGGGEENYQTKSQFAA
jgi:hypothetical protein